jgi:ornithine cyclodeaminase
VRVLDADAVSALGPAAAVRAIRDALLEGLDPASDPPRVSVDLSQGQFLLMPSEVSSAAGVKVVTVAPANPALGLPRIQAAYLVFDRRTLSLSAVLDGTALTTLRTPAVSVAAVVDRLRTGGDAAVRALDRPDARLRLAVTASRVGRGRARARSSG